MIVKDIADDGAFDRVLQTSPPFEGVIHTASPFRFDIQSPQKDLLEPAVKGTTNILEAIHAHAPAVKRIVITSSLASMLNMKAHPLVYTSGHWNPVTLEEAASNPADGYRGSKTFAERAAWKFLQDTKPQFTLATINPALVFGPIVHHLNSLDAINTSNARFRDMMSGRMREGIAPTGTFYWVDVRDVALAHVRALERESAAGQRFLLAASTFSNCEIAKIIRARFADLRPLLPENCESDLPKDLYGVDCSKSREFLDLDFTELKRCTVDTVESLLAVGA